MLGKNLVWNVEFLDTAIKQLRKIDRQWQSVILDYLDNEICPLENPRLKGKQLIGNKKGLWRYRVGNYRIICDIQDDNSLIIVALIGHRKDIYT